MADHDFGPIVTSVHNPSIRYARSLQRRKVRQRERAFLVEGPRVIVDAFARGQLPQCVFLDESAGHEVIALGEQLASAGVRVVRVDNQLVQLLSETESPQGILAIFSIPDLPLPHLDSPLFVVADQIRDPGNLGTLMRSTLASGCAAMLIAPGTVDPLSPKVVRSAMGAHFGLPLRWISWHDLPAWIPNNASWYAAEATGEITYERVDWTLTTCLVIGGETEGISKSAGERVSERVSIPLHQRVESLNAAVAGSIILFEADRQRRGSGTRLA